MYAKHVHQQLFGERLVCNQRRHFRYQPCQGNRMSGNLYVVPAMKVHIVTGDLQRTAAQSQHRKTTIVRETIRRTLECCPPRRNKCHVCDRPSANFRADSESAVVLNGQVVVLRQLQEVQSTIVSIWRISTFGKDQKCYLHDFTSEMRTERTLSHRNDRFCYGKSIQKHN